ncbi:hypothetical protein HA402_009108 [Bradysia odoriphaga]|nr:hypothetical protein HA402_009108 [Bradysia odoriphaga]
MVLRELQDDKKKECVILCHSISRVVQLKIVVVVQSFRIYFIRTLSILQCKMTRRVNYLLVTVIAAVSAQMVDGQFNYSTCENATCFGLPDHCLDTLDCQAVCKVNKISSDVYQFEVEAISQTNESTSPLAYVAVGLSLDSRMNDDSVVECVMMNNQVEVFMSYTRQSPRAADRHTYTDEIRVTQTSYSDGRIRCAFERKAVTVINNQIFDLNGIPHHLLLAVGTDVDATSLRRHTMRLASNEPIIVPESVEIPNQNIDYDACAITQTCFGMPNGCVSAKNCHTAITITYTSPTYKFQMVTSSGTAYVAMGLSMDNKMGSDSVIECVRENDTVNMYTSYTRNDHAGSDRHSPTGVATLLDSSYVDGLIYCYVERNETGTVFDQEFDLANQLFYILVAIGDETTATSLTVHKQRQVSSQAIHLPDVVNLKEAAKPLLIKLHGCFMIFAWMGTAAVGLVLARYFKREWSNKTVFGKDVWFIGHVACMAITWTLTLVAFVMIFVHVGGWTQIGNTHGILGIVVTILCFFQPIGAAFRPHPKHPRRIGFNIGHYFIGRIAFLLAKILPDIVLCKA